MKYRLKDQELQAKLDELTNGEFSASLKGNIEPTDYYRRFNVDGIGVISVSLNSSCLEERFDYDPRSWNPFPEVTPPENVLMRVERTEFGSDRNGKGITQRDCSIFRKGEWVDPVVGYPMSMKIGRFRPWDEDQEAEE